MYPSPFSSNVPVPFFKPDPFFATDPAFPDIFQHLRSNQVTTTTNFDVIIPTLNEEGFIVQCIKSIRDQCGETTHIVVVDNGSKDRTVALATELGVEVIETSGQTIAGQRNLGAANSKGNLLAFLDADCTVLPGWSQAAMETFQDQTVVAAGAVPELPQVNTTWVQRTWEFMKRRKHQRSTETTWLPSANLWIRKSAFDQVSGFNEEFESCEDADIGYRLSKIGRLVHNPQIRIEHHREPRTIRQFFHKEVWHGKNSYDGITQGRITMSELPSLLAPIWMFVGTVVLLIGFAVWLSNGNRLTFWSGLLAAAALPLAYALRAIVNKGNAQLFPQVLFMYVIYFAARMVAFLNWGLRKAIKA